MSLDKRIRDSLASAADGHDPGPPPTEALAANVGRRQRTKLAASGLTAMATVILIAGLVALPGASTPKETVRVDQPASGVAEGESTETTVLSETTTTFATPPTSDPTIPPPTAGPPSNVGSGPTVPPPSTTRMVTTTVAQPPGTVTVTQDDGGKTFTLRRGQHLVVSLSDSSSEWSAPESDNSNVLLRTAVSANPSSTQVTASFDAKGVGQAHASATMDPLCRRSEPPCGRPSQLWQITVNVI